MVNKCTALGLSGFVIGSFGLALLIVGWKRGWNKESEVVPLIGFAMMVVGFAILGIMGSFGGLTGGTCEEEETPEGESKSRRE